MATDVTGKSARRMLQALIAGSTDAATMAQLAERKLRAKIPELEKALSGRFAPHQRFMLAEQLGHIDFLDESIERVSAEIEERMLPFEAEIERLDSIPGVARRTAEELVSEIGVDVDRFPTAGHLASWAGMCPGNNESAGKRYSGKTRKGDPWLRAALVEAAKGAARTRDTYLSAQYHRLVRRRGKKKAAVAVGHSILIIAYHLLERGCSYQELGGNYFDERDRQGVERRLVRRLQALGYTVALNEVAA